MSTTVIKQVCWYVFQEKVACLDDNDARLAMDPKNKYRIQVTLCMFFKIEQNYCMLLDIKS